MGIDLRQRFIEDFIKVGRVGKKYFVFGAPEDLEGPYDNSRQANRAYNYILDNFEDFEVVNRYLVKKTKNNKKGK